MQHGTRGANTFPLRNQSLALESLKDQLGFLVTIILGDDSFIHKNKKPEINSPLPGMVAAMPRSAQGCKRMATPLGTLGLGLVIVIIIIIIIIIIMLCVVVFL